MKNFIEKLKAGHNYINWKALAINEGGFWFTFHISYDGWTHYFFFRVFFFGKSVQILWNKPNKEAEMKRMKHKVEHAWNDAMRNGVIVEVKETKNESPK